MALEVKIHIKDIDLVGKGTIDGVIPFYFKDQGHRWMVRIGQNWTLKQQEARLGETPSMSAARNKIYWAIAQFRNHTRDQLST